jgi:hypothetical protein
MKRLDIARLALLAPEPQTPAGVPPDVPLNKVIVEEGEQGFGLSHDRRRRGVPGGNDERGEASRLARPPERRPRAAAPAIGPDSAAVAEPVALATST